MKQSFALQLFVSALILTITSNAQAGSGSGSAMVYGNDIVSIDVGVWITTGSGEWETSFRFNDPFVGSGRSKLEWEDLESPVPFIGAKVKVSDLVSLRGRFGKGSISNGSNTDSDWIDAPSEGLYDYKFLESEAETDGDTAFAHMDILFNLKAIPSFKKLKADLYTFLGYHYYTDELNDTEGITTLFFDEQIHEPFPGLDSTYDFQWQMFRIGAGAEIPVHKKLTLSGEIAAMILLDYEGEAYWNLRAGSGPDDFREESPNFVQEADDGDGVDAHLALTYAVHKNAAISLGYEVMYFRARDGDDTIYFSDGTTEKTALNDIESMRHGVFFKVSGRF